jgi:hypothetical protein
MEATLAKWREGDNNRRLREQEKLGQARYSVSAGVAELTRFTNSL